jgi:hypothetical protein
MECLGWRIGQRRECRVYYLFYEATMQAAAMALMGRKLSAAQALEGKFSAEGLVALGGEDVSVEMALAQALDEHLPGDTLRAWETIAETADGAVKGGDAKAVPVAVATEPQGDLESLLALVGLGAGPAEGGDDLADFLDTMAAFNFDASLDLLNRL